MHTHSNNATQKLSKNRTHTVANSPDGRQRVSTTTIERSTAPARSKSRENPD